MRLEERRVQVPCTYPGDRPQFDDHHRHRKGRGDTKVGNEMGQGVAEAGLRRPASPRVTIWKPLQRRLKEWNTRRASELHDVRTDCCRVAHNVHMLSDMAAASADGGPIMHPQIAKSFINLMSTRRRPPRRRRFWLLRLIGRA
jgi:hypothetical protein